MDISTTTADSVLAPLVSMAARGSRALTAVLDNLDAPIYLTDADGFVTYFNRACLGFTGRTPVLGKDRWCVTWKLFTADGEDMPHDQCPMAVAVRSGRPIRGAIAVAARPDGSRVRFTPFPTPLRGPSGNIIGAINILLDVTDTRQPSDLQFQAERCLRLAAGSDDEPASAALREMAVEYDVMAASLRENLGAVRIPA